MTNGNFYFLTDDYCAKFRKYGVMDNKETVGSIVHGRPCFYAFQDINDKDLYWMIPVSSQIDKYKKLLKEKLKKYDDYDGLEFGYVRGRYAAFLIQNICPATQSFIREEYIDCNTNSPVSIPNDLKRRINAKARKIISLYKKGIRASITDIQSILQELK